MRLGMIILFAIMRMKKSFIVLMTLRHISRLRKRFAQRYEAFMLDYLFVSEQLSFLTSTFFILLSSMAECSQLWAMKSIVNISMKNMWMNPIALAQSVLKQKRKKFLSMWLIGALGTQLTQLLLPWVYLPCWSVWPCLDYGGCTTFESWYCFVLFCVRVTLYQGKERVNSI